jgi:uncharacterized protein (DUF433 family)
VRKAERDFVAANDLSSQISLLLKGSCMFDRITSDSAILGGKPIIRGKRISVAMILEWIASGADRDTILRKHPQLSADDVEQAVEYAVSAARNEVLLTTEVGGDARPWRIDGDSWSRRFVSSLLVFAALSRNLV